MKKLASVLLIMALALSLCELPAFAVTRARTVSIYPTFRTLRRGRTVQFTEKVYPDDVDYDDIEWSSSNYDVLEVDEFGEVTAINVGEADITCRIYGDDGNGKSIRLGSGTATITVVSNLVTDNPPSDEATSGDDSASAPAPSGAASTKKLSASDANLAVNKAIYRGRTTSATFKDVGSVSASVLQSAADTMKIGGGTVLLNFDTTSGKSVEGRLTINPIAAKDVKGDIKLGIYTNDGAVADVRKKFERSFNNDMLVVKAAHSGSYGMDVTCAVRLGSELSKSKKLRLYGYNPDTNKYSEIKNANIRVDANRYARFTTRSGDYLVISNGELSK